VPESAGLVDAVLDQAATDLAAAALAGVVARDGYACPGVADLLAAVAADETVVSTLVTGNIYLNALVKVAAFGLDKWLDTDVGAYGSDARDRNLLVPIAMARVARERGVPADLDDVWVIGDTPRDLECARAAGVRCLLVGTGRYSTEELAPLGADDVLDDLADTDAVLKLLLGSDPILTS
jgi:phosphoglycolate phosphatase-like HAD superfamily hydrolase